MLLRPLVVRESKHGGEVRERGREREGKSRREGDREEEREGRRG